MAATDQTYRTQKTLDVVFGASCVLMLGSIIWMFAQDYNREYKKEIRGFRDVEEAVAEREVLRRIPEKSKVTEAEEALKAARANRDQKRAENRDKAKELGVKKVKDENKAQALKADLDSKKSLLDISRDERNVHAAGSAEWEKANHNAEAMAAAVAKLQGDYNAASMEVEKTNKELDDLKKKEVEADKVVEKAAKDFKDLTADFDRFAKLAVQKRWKIGDWIRTMPVLDGFASPTRIEQIVLNDLPIDYNFKFVTRYDRCTTCHLGIDRAVFDKQTLEALTKDVSEADHQKLVNAKQMFADRLKNLDDKKAVDFDFNNLRLTQLSKSDLPEWRVNQYSAHPRLDLFVDGNSAHPKEKFGCTICHSGQGSATDFNLAAHSPDDEDQKERWKHVHDWESNHFWDFPMLPARFLESSCLKCHYQVTDLTPKGEQTEMRAGKAVESPGSKVVRGYNLVKDNGCFGCHEISGIKSGREVGPDLRLEPTPPLEAMTAAERNKMMADPLNLPGTLRKVGPSLKRINEKTNQEWVRRWLEGPREFRPDTKMPHFYNLSNNRKDVLPASQKDFPDAEIHALAYYLFRESRDYVAGKDTAFQANSDRQRELQDKRKDHIISESEKRELEEVTRRLELMKPPVPIKKKLIAGDGKEVQLPDWLAKSETHADHAKKGRLLFSEKGCLACHQHQGTIKAEGDAPEVASQAQFGPNLSEIVRKLTTDDKKEVNYRWLVQWILNPNVHSPRTRMPITHLTVEEASEVASWLLSQKPSREWRVADPEAPTLETLESLARVWLEKSVGKLEAESILKGKGLSAEQEQSLKERNREADELHLAASRHESDGGADQNWADKLKWYVGRKAISQMGCYACHDIPGFDGSKPIGTALNDWGKKDPERLAFEDIVAYAKQTYHVVAERDDPKDPTKAAKDWGAEAKDGKEKPPYEKFFFDALEHHQRQGFLHQKLMDPRSYDFDRDRHWDERLRMPQFKFSRTVLPDDATAEQKAQAERDEAEARETVMTFILGLVAEPIPPAYVAKPQAEKLAVAQGKHVLEKFNCAGCHHLEAGTYEFKLTDSLREQLESLAAKPDAPEYKGDFRAPFRDQSEWTGQRSAKDDRVTFHWMPEPQGGTIRLTEAVRFTGQNKEILDVPAANSVGLPENNEGLLSRSMPHGGVLADLLVPYLKKRNKLLFDDYKNARAALPPPLLREGEKVQPSWLFQFLRDPHEIRPMTVLRMPKFNMSEDEAMALVNYFAAVDKQRNPDGGLSYPYTATPQRSESYWVKETAEYLDRLKKDGKLPERLRELEPLGDWLAKERLNGLEGKIPDTEAAVKTAKNFEAKQTDPAKKKEAKEALDKAEQTLAALKKEVDQLKDPAKGKETKGAILKTQVKHWESDGAYATDAFRLLANYNNPCLSCHNVGSLKAKNGREAQGPPLDLAWQRLRPEWTARWIANPDRMLSYPTPMPSNFKGVDPYPEFDGNLLQQIFGVRDVLMDYPKVEDMPVNRFFRPASLGEVK